MLQITVPALEGWDESKQEFVSYKAQTLQLEHSLIAISKWESKWHKPFLVKEQKTREETLYYIKCMTITQNVDPEVYNRLTQQNIDDINAYIDDPMTATTFSDEQNGKPSREIITSELIDYWMIANNIPVEYRKWHLNRLITLIKICSVKNSPPKKHSKKELLSRNAALNAERRKRLNSKG